MTDAASHIAPDPADIGVASIAGIFSRPLLPNEPRIGAESTERTLTDLHLMPVLAELEVFFLAIRAEVDAILRTKQPIKLGKPYPLGQCLEITLAVQKHLQGVDTAGLDHVAARGQAALASFLRAGGCLRQVWGDLRGQYFQNAFLIGTLYVDVSNDTVVATKPKVEILPFASSQLTPVKSHQHFKKIAEQYWQGQVFPNHVLPEIAPYCPLIHVSPAGIVRMCEATDYMVSMTLSKHFRSSEEVLNKPLMPAELFKYLLGALQNTKLKLARNPEQGRTLSLRNCKQYREKRWYMVKHQTAQMMLTAQLANKHLEVVKPLGRIIPAPAKIEKINSPDKASLVAEEEKIVIEPNTAPIKQSASRTPDFTVVSKSRHTGKRWRRCSEFHFAAHNAVIPLMAQELAQAILSLPVGLIASGMAYVPVAVQGLHPDQNVFVAPDGRWLGDYLPAIYRNYPFILGSKSDGQQILCIDQDSGLITDDPQDEPFFNDDGTPAQAVQDVLNSLAGLQANREATGQICAMLQKHRLIQPWPVNVLTKGGERNIEGLYRIDEVALNALQPDALVELRDAGALAFAYCQLLSMQNLPKLASLL